MYNNVRLVLKGVVHVRMAGRSLEPKRSDEMSVYGFSIHKLDQRAQKEVAIKQAKVVRFLKLCEGFAGLVQNANSSLLLFMTKEQAEMARDGLMAQGWSSGRLIFEYYVPKSSLG